MEKKYKILIDYGAYEGMKWWNDYETSDLNEAVKIAQANTYGSSFYIVQVVDWEAKVVL